MSIKKTVFGKTADGRQVDLFTMTNANGLVASVMTWGATLTNMEAPDRDGKPGRITFGYDSLEGYFDNPAYFGCTVGRCANRISKAKFTLDGEEYTLAANVAPNHLHGGIKGFNSFVWDAKEIDSAAGDSVEFTFLSPDGQEGYPGNLSVKVVYTLTDDNELKIDYTAVTDKPAIVNLTNHAYWNLADAGASDILNHELTLFADTYVPTNEQQMPTGEIFAVAGTPMDFNNQTAIGARINQVEGGYDHNWVVNASQTSPAPAAKVYEPVTGRTLEVFTTEPGIQLYAGNHLDGSITGAGGTVYKYRHGLCLETQHFPDSPNQPEFPSIVLRPGQTYRQLTVHKFGAE